MSAWGDTLLTIAGIGLGLLACLGAFEVGCAALALVARWRGARRQ